MTENDLTSPNNLGNVGFPLGFFSHASAVQTEKQNTAGFPTQFRYNELPEDYFQHSQQEYVAVNLSPYSQVQQNSQKDPVTGKYIAMVYDTPFDQINFNKTNDNLAFMGFASLALAVMFL